MNIDADDSKKIQKQSYNKQVISYGYEGSSIVSRTSNDDELGNLKNKTFDSKQVCWELIRLIKSIII